MKQLIYLFVIIFTLSYSFSSCDSDDSVSEMEIVKTLPFEAEIIFNVSYGSDSQQVYDLYLPQGRTSQKTKVIVVIHGGGWTEGDKSDMDEIISFLLATQPNHAIVNINYILAEPPTVPAFPNQFLDLGLVIEQITLQKEALQILPEFGLIGTSAGAHISMMYDYVYDTINQVKMVCDIVGPSDFTDPYFIDNPLFEIYLNAMVDEDAYPIGSNYSEVLSPAIQVTQNSSPTLLFYGNNDPLVPLTNGNRLDEALTNNAVNHNYTIYDGGHGDWDEDSYADLIIQLTNFIDTYLEVE